MIGWDGLHQESSETLRIDCQRLEERENRELNAFTPVPWIFALGFLVGDSSGDEKGKKQNANDAEEGERLDTI